MDTQVQVRALLNHKVLAAQFMGFKHASVQYKYFTKLGQVYWFQLTFLYKICLASDRTAIRGDVPEIEVRRALSTYLSRLTLTDKDAFGLLLPDHDFPEGFHLLHKRCCKRKMYSTRAGFFAILSQEDSWSIDSFGNETSRESVIMNV